MADIKIVGGKAEARKAREDKKHHHHKPVGPTDPPCDCLFGFGPKPIWPPYPMVTPSTPATFTTIYANKTGSDKSGDGSKKKPYRTFQRAIRDVGHVIPPGTGINIDVTNLGVEMFPGAYKLQEMHCSYPLVQADDVTTNTGTPAAVSSAPFRFVTTLNIKALPQPASHIPLADTHVPAGNIVSITADPNTGLAIVTTATPRASWAGSALKGNLLIGDGPATTSCAIYDSDATHLFLCNDPGSVPVQNLTIAEPSATFQTPFADPNAVGWGTFDTPWIAFQGIRFVCTEPTANSFCVDNTPQCFIELCDFRGFCLDAVLLQCLTASSVIRDTGLDVESADWYLEKSLVLNTGPGSSGYFIIGGSQIAFDRVVFDGNTLDLGPAAFPGPFSFNGALNWTFINVLMKNSSAPDSAIIAQGTGLWTLDTVEIQGSTANALTVQGLVSAILSSVTGAGNGGFGVQVADGAQVRVADYNVPATPVTTVTGASGDMQVGTLVPRTWTDFRTTAPINNEYDLTTPFVAASSGAVQPPGDELTGPDTGGRSGSRLFARV